MNFFVYYVKKNFPKTYTRVRTTLFPLVDSWRRKKATAFIDPAIKNVSILGYQYKIKLNPANGFIDTQIFTTGQYELDILEVIKQHLHAGEVFVDIGGNIGWHTLFAAHVTGAHGHVYTFEPIPKLVSQIQDNVNINGLTDRVTVFPFGCSFEETKKDLHINAINIGGSSLYTPTAESHTTEVVTLKIADTVLNSITTPISLIKIDTEGYELEVLRGLTNTLQKYRPKLIVEYSPSFWGAASLDRSLAFFKLLSAYNYDIFDLESGHTQIHPTEAWIKSFTKLQTNFLCVAKT